MIPSKVPSFDMDNNDVVKLGGLVLKDNMQYFTFLQSLYIENWVSDIEILYFIVYVQYQTVQVRVRIQRSQQKGVAASTTAVISVHFVHYTLLCQLISTDRLRII